MAVQYFKYQAQLVGCWVYLGVILLAGCLWASLAVASQLLMARPAPASCARQAILAALLLANTSLPSTAIATVRARLAYKKAALSHLASVLGAALRQANALAAAHRLAGMAGGWGIMGVGI